MTRTTRKSNSLTVEMERDRLLSSGVRKKVTSVILSRPNNKKNNLSKELPISSNLVEQTKLKKQNSQQKELPQAKTNRVSHAKEIIQSNSKITLCKMASSLRTLRFRRPVLSYSLLVVAKTFSRFSSTVSILFTIRKTSSRVIWQVQAKLLHSRCHWRSDWERIVCLEIVKFKLSLCVQQEN